MSPKQQTVGKNERCFVITPIGDERSPMRFHADMVLNSIIKPALPGHTVKRADEFSVPDMINDRIIEAISTYELAIADLTHLNPNVFYELGLRHAAEKAAIHIAQEGTRLPFDNAGVGTIFYNINDWNSHVRARQDITTAVEKISSQSPSGSFLSRWNRL